LPERKEIPLINTFFPGTAEYSPGQRAEDVKLVVERAKKDNLSAFGAYSNGTVELGVANSLGIEAYTIFTDAFLNVIMMSDGASGYANFVSRDIEDIDVRKTAEEAIEKCLKSKNPLEIEPGEYEVILEGYAVSDLLLFLGHLGFSALAVQEGRSFMCNKLGQRIMGENITIGDDGLSLESFAIPFDFEGLPKQKVILIEKGIARNVVYDSYAAGKEGKNSTGHALPSPNTCGPMPLNLFLKNGEATKEEMISSTKRGILVTRFHYTNVVEPMKTIITGMTRNGTFLIEEGKIKHPVKNLRFTESILKVLSKVSMISKKRKLVSEGTIYERRFATGSVVPTIRVDKFNFTGVTQF
jgi:predicted Zn-dependent protease